MILTFKSNDLINDKPSKMNNCRTGGFFFFLVSPHSFMLL